jgi:hypothetical protein
LPVAVSQTLSVPSRLPMGNALPSGVKTTV